jgi:hypothetical protein
MSCSSAVIPAPSSLAVTVIAAAIPALCISVRISGTAQDPRAVVTPIFAATGARIAADRYADYDASRTFLCKPQLRPNEDTADIVVTAKLAYDRFKNYAARKDSVSKPVAGCYRKLNALPHLDVFNGRPTFGYFTPVLRVVAREVGGAA